jgi:CRISPR/Cas system-associated endonuclease Cas1
MLNVFVQIFKTDFQDTNERQRKDVINAGLSCGMEAKGQTSLD